MGPYGNLILCILAVGAGISSAAQHLLNMNLRFGLGSPWWAGLVSYLTGTVAMLAVVLMSGSSWSSNVVSANTPWISWVGGVFGAIFVGTMILITPRLGLATVLALVVVGQMVGAMAFDHFGLLGVPQQPASSTRIIGAGLLVLGVVLIRG
ncbi:DMT family transporter [Pseudochelatococcus sp. B33]